MKRSLLELLVDPGSGAPLRVEATREAEGEIIEGGLHDDTGRSYSIRNGIPRFVASDDAGQRQTAESFGYKWKKRETYDSEGMNEIQGPWLSKKYGFADVPGMRSFFGGRRRILDAGCGAGLSTGIWMSPSWRGNASGEWFGVDVSTAVDVARERLGACPGTHFIQADILALPFREATFDTIFSEGVLHHTPSTELALKTLARLLQPGGQFLFYVYRKKGPIREFTDDHVRSLLSGLPPDEAWELLRPLTRLAQALSDLHVKVDVPEDIPYLGIKAGEQDVQRLIYWSFAKLYWNEKLSFEENVHVNFDWYHPRYAHRQTEEEVRRWCREACLSIVHFDAQESGFTVRAEKL